jgi:radical SAM protein with 4Fe4S-binding SPASM domain
MTAFDPLIHALERAEAATLPLNVTAEITHACNIDCEHCYLDLQPDSKTGAMSTDEWKRVFREVRAAGALFLTITGGEPLVRKDWFELASYARELGFAIKIFTNATLIDDANADRIASLRPMGVEISLLGGTPEVHNAIAQRKNAFERTVAGARRLHERKVPLLLKTALLAKNVGELDAMRAIAASVGAQMYFDVEVSPKNNGSLGPQSHAPDAAALEEAGRDIGRHNQERYGKPSPVSREARLGATPCSAGRRAAHIGPAGDVFPCTSWTKPVGSLREKSFGEIWGTNETFAEIRAKRLRDFPVCARCELVDLCSPCMALSVLERGVIDGPSPTKCTSAEIKARARGRHERSAWLLEQEAAGHSSRARVRLPLVP